MREPFVGIVDVEQDVGMPRPRRTQDPNQGVDAVAGEDADKSRTGRTERQDSCPRSHGPFHEFGIAKGD